MLSLEKRDWIKLILGIRKSLNLSQMQFSKEVGISRKAISRFESFQRAPNKISISKLDHFIVMNTLDKNKLIKIGKSYINEYKKRQKVKKLNLEPSEELAELIGIILGDGEIKPDCIRIAFDPKKDTNFLNRRVFYLIKKLIGGNITFESKKRISVYNMGFVRYLIDDCKLKSGSKAKNNSTIPLWCFDNDRILKSIIRGIFDTDGYIGYQDHSIKIMFGRFTDKCTKLVNDLEKGLDILGISYKTTHTNDGRYVIDLVGTENVLKFFMGIGSSNLKHTIRFLLWRIIRYPAKIEKEGLESLIKRTNNLLDFDIKIAYLPFIWNKKNTNFIELINEDIIYLESLKVRREFNWSTILSQLTKQVPVKEIASDLDIGERSIRRWREGVRIPSPKFVPYLIELSKRLNIL